MLKYKNTALVATLPLLLLQGCGGGGDNGNSSSTAVGNNITWSAGDFSTPASEFANKCSIARTGIDPIHRGLLSRPNRFSTARKNVLTCVQ